MVIYFTILDLSSGQVQKHSYGTYEDKQWFVNSTCDSVHIMSTMFELQPNASLTIDGIPYVGDREINQLVPKSFIIYFNSFYAVPDDGFVLNWRCTEWGDWTDLSGTCNQVRRPSTNEQNLIGELDYRKIVPNCGNKLFLASVMCAINIVVVLTSFWSDIF